MITLTKSQAEQCMRADPEFVVNWKTGTYKMIGTVMFFIDRTERDETCVPSKDWCLDGWWHESEYPTCTIHADPNETYKTLIEDEMEPTKETNEEQKYLTRSEALKVMEEGGKVEQVWDDSGRKDVFWFEGGFITSNVPEINAAGTFMCCPKYKNVTPDSPEKFVRWLYEGYGNLSRAGYFTGLTSVDSNEVVTDRLRALVEQMDKEGK